MIISISIPDILARVYAQVALSYAVSAPDTPVLTDDDDESLTLLAEAVAADVSLVVSPILDDIDINASADGMIRLTVNEECRTNPVELRLLTEQAITGIILSEVYVDASPDTSDRYLLQAEKTIERLQSLMATAFPLRIYPYPN